MYSIPPVLQLYCIQTEDWRIFYDETTNCPFRDAKKWQETLQATNQNELLIRCKVGSLELSFFSSIDASQQNEILEKVFAYGTKLEWSGSCLHHLWKKDLRKGIDSLAYLIQSQFNLDPFSKSVFLFLWWKKWSI